MDLGICRGEDAARDETIASLRLVRAWVIESDHPCPSDCAIFEHVLGNNHPKTKIGNLRT